MSGLSRKRVSNKDRLERTREREHVRKRGWYRKGERHARTLVLVCCDTRPNKTQCSAIYPHDMVRMSMYRNTHLVWIPRRNLHAFTSEKKQQQQPDENTNTVTSRAVPSRLVKNSLGSRVVQATDDRHTKTALSHHVPFRVAATHSTSRRARWCHPTPNTRTSNQRCTSLRKYYNKNITKITMV